MALLGERVELDQLSCSLTPDSLSDLGVEEKKNLLLLSSPTTKHTVGFIQAL